MRSCWSAILGPYYCAMGSLSRWTSDCLLEPENVNLSALIDQTKKYESRGMIDPTSNMLNDRVFIFHGLNDTRVVPGHTLSLIHI